MRRIAVFGVAALVLVVMASSAASRTQIRPGTASIRITSEAVSVVGANLNGNGRVGDATVEQVRLYNRRITPTSIGHGILLCTNLGDGGVLGGGKRWCRGTYVLPRGSLIVEGVKADRRFYYQLVVLGGTGVYRNVAAGTVSIARRAENPREDSLIFLLYSA